MFLASAGLKHTQMSLKEEKLPILPIAGPKRMLVVRLLGFAHLIGSGHVGNDKHKRKFQISPGVVSYIRKLIRILPCQPVRVQWIHRGHTYNDAKHVTEKVLA